MKEIWDVPGQGNNDDKNQNAITEQNVDLNDVTVSLKRRKAKQIVLTIIQENEALGVEEVVMKMPRRQYSIQVASDQCVYLHLSSKNFREKFFNQSYALKHLVCEKLEM